MSSQTNKKITSAVDALVPSSHAYTIYSTPTGFDGMEVVRVITPAWKNLGKAERITKVQNAVVPALTSAEYRRIFRFSVLTPQEWETLRDQFVGRKIHKVGARS